MARPSKYPPDPPNCSRGRPTASEKHRKLNEQAGPGRWRWRKRGHELGRVARGAKDSHKTVAS